MNFGLIRTALGAVATAAVVGSLISCSSSADDPSSASVPSSPSTEAGEPASRADQDAMTAVFERYVDTSNKGDSQAYLATVCATDPAHSQAITDRGPAPHPVSIEDMKDFTVDGDNGLATVTVKIGSEDTAEELTSRFNFVRESGSWTVCGEKED